MNTKNICNRKQFIDEIYKHVKERFEAENLCKSVEIFEERHKGARLLSYSIQVDEYDILTLSIDAYYPESKKAPTSFYSISIKL